MVSAERERERVLERVADFMIERQDVPVCRVSRASRESQSCREGDIEKERKKIYRTSEQGKD